MVMLDVVERRMIIPLVSFPFLGFLVFFYGLVINPDYST
jgi:hypothetical protein